MTDINTQDFGAVGEDLETINTRLVNIFGTNIVGHAKYRIVKADDQLEKRLGTYTDWDDNGNFIRRVREVREVLKYPNSLGYYILEKWISLPTNFDGIYGHNGYEQLWTFRSSDYAVQPLYWRAINFLVKMNLHGVNQSLAEIWAERENIEKKEFEYFMDYLNAEAKAFDGALSAGEAVFIDSTKEKK